MDLDFKNIVEAVDQIIMKQSKVDLQLKNFGKYTIEDLSKAYLQGFELSHHNYMNDTTNGNMLCYDLMACLDPYDINNKQQYFYTLFSRRNVIVKKDILAWIYDGYMNIDEYKKYHIDIMLQICYNNNTSFQKEDDTYKKIEFIHKNGLCLQFDDSDDNTALYKCVKDEPFYIKTNESTNNIIKSIISSPKMGELYNYIRSVECKILDNGEDPAAYLAYLTEQRKYGKLQKKRLKIMETIEAAIDEYIPSNDFSVPLNEAIEEILRDYTSPKVFKDFVRICIINILAVPSIGFLYFIPLPFPNNLQIGHYAYSSFGKLNKMNISQMRLLANILMFPLVQSNIVLGYVRKIRHESIKSAKAAIMSRNMSHNLGSHVMAYLKQNLGSVIDIVKGNVIEKIVSNNHLNTQMDLWEDYLNNEADTGVKDRRQNGSDENKYMNQIELPFLVGIGHFISYMQERQDYIATVSTDYVPYFSSLNFKDDIYDVLNPDLRYLRHTDRIGGRPDNILLSFIARSEGLQRPAYANILVHNGASISLKNQAEFDALKTCCIKRRENDIVIKFREFDGLNDAEFTPVTIECGDQSADIYKRKYDSHNQANEKDLNDMRSFNLSLPGGIAGRQAVFSIIENIIRNAAKHGSWEKSQEKRLELTFDVYDCSEEDSRFMNSGDCESLQLKKYLKIHGYFGAKDSRDLYILTITDNIPIESKKVEQLKEAIKQDYVYDDCSMINENKGIKEIKISASWLRNLTHEEDELDMAPVLNVRLANECLQYIICIPKVKKYAIICPDPALYVGGHLQSIYYYKKDSFKKERNKSFEVIAILDDDANGKVYEEIKNEIIPLSPNHIVKISGDDLKAIHAELKSQSGDKTIKTDLWQRIDDMYARMYGIEEKAMITIIDKKVADSAKAKHYNNETKRVECLVGEVASGSLSPFVYKTHLETEKNFYDFLRTYVINKENSGLSFAEGISGGNSTDRLVRGVECGFTTEWYYRHLNAMRKRIAIFDERLFSKTTNLTDSELGGVDNSIIKAIEKGAQETPDECVNAEEVQELSKIGLEVEGCTYQLVYEYVGDMVAENKFQYAKSHLIAVNHYKNISIYNIIFNSATQEFDIYGYTEMEPSVDAIKFRVGNVGKIVRKGDDIDIIFKGPGFDYLSIHQGLLDKIYHQWGIADSSKCKVTQALYDKVMQKKETVLFDGYQYLLGLIIHSGRAKPSATDMPQKQPFIQYASLDHAVSDCKYTLVELLDNARYE